MNRTAGQCIVGPEQFRRGGGVDHRDARRVLVVARLEAPSSRIFIVSRQPGATVIMCAP